MEPFEAAALLSNRDLVHRDDWERTRLLAYITAQANSTKTLSPADVLPLPWDDDAGGAVDTEMTEDERVALAAMTKQVEQNLNGR
jgi:hypothetical protein